MSETSTIGNPLGGAWGKRWKSVRQSMPVNNPETQAAFDCMMEVCKRGKFTMLQVDGMTVWEFARHIHELRLTDKAPQRLRLPLEPLPPLLPEPGTMPLLEVGARGLLFLIAFNDREPIPEEDDALLYALEERGYMRNDRDEFGDSWSITAAGRAYVAKVRAAQPGADGADAPDDFELYGDGEEDAQPFNS